jgi:DNA-binding transcriptional MerR regulator
MNESADHLVGIPDKLYFRIGEVSRIADVPTSVLRFWESEFPRIHPQRTDAGQRLYRRSDVELILTIKRLLYNEKFTIKGARKYLNTQQSQAAGPPLSGSIIETIRDELTQIRDLLK